jgi:alpha-galactosidase
LAELSPGGFALVEEGITAYKTWRSRLPSMVPFWPLGCPSFSAPVLALGLADNQGHLLAVWNLGSEAVEVRLPLERFPNGPQVPQRIYPRQAPDQGPEIRAGTLTVVFPPGPSARVLKGTREREKPSD